jgi:hypothetical protein
MNEFNFDTRQRRTYQLGVIYLVFEEYPDMRYIEFFSDPDLMKLVARIVQIKKHDDLAWDSPIFDCNSRTSKDKNQIRNYIRIVDFALDVFENPDDWFYKIQEGRIIE